MASEAHVAAGDRAFVDEEYEAALGHYSKALEAGPPSAAIHEARASALIKLGRFLEAVGDASKALELEPANAKALLRKGVACFQLDEYETALDCFEAGAARGSSQCAAWVTKAKAQLEGEGGAAAASVPTPAPQPTPQPTAAPTPAPAPAAAAAAAGAQQPAPASAPLAPAAAAAAAPAGRFRHQWYQLGPKVVVDVYAKNTPKEGVQVQLCDSNSRLCITVTPDAAAQQAAAAAAVSSSSGEAGAGASSSSSSGSGSEPYVLELELFAPVAPDVQVEVLRTKIEVTMLKANAGLSWPSLEKGRGGPAPAGVAAAAVPAAAAAAAGAPTDAGPPRTYPSSKGPKDWSKVEAEVKELEDKGELDEGDPLGAFFKKIFAQGDEDTRRAMMKSFVESNGTVLSTNWGEVGAKPVECTPPEGMEVHKWSEDK